MKNGLIAVVLVLVVASGLVWAAKTTQPIASRTQWEYKYVTLLELAKVQSSFEVLSKAFSGEDMNAKIGQAMNDLGKQGWELIHVGDNGYIFKRPVE